MITITLPDGSQKQFEKPVTVYDVALNIGEGLARAALAGRVDDKLMDLSFQINNDTKLAIITDRDPDGLEIIRHSTAHLLAQAVKQLFPEAQVTIGPVIENGFYYDFDYQRAFTPEDLLKIEGKMRELAKKGLPVKRFEMNRDQAIKFFEDQGEKFKVEIIKDLPEGQVLSFYQQDEFVDLCRGPHVPNTDKLKVFKLMSVAGAYWRGDSNNPMLQRIYGTAWATKQDLADYLHRLQEAEKRDHRKIAKALDLFHLQEEAPGMVFWHEKGWIIYQVIEQHMREKLRVYGYQEVRTPQIVSRSLWERSGHWDKFGNEMFVTKSEQCDFAIKPMNCPCHVQIFNHHLHSYRELPLKIAEFGSCHRNEPSGALHGLMRVRNMVQDDAHVFCTEEQIQDEVTELIKLLFEFYTEFGFDKVLIRLSTRPDLRVGSDAIWDKAEKALAEALDHYGLEWQLDPGEGAFYGPKIDFHLQDCLDRIWQCGTIQLDFLMPERLGAKYVAEDSSRKTPVMIHRTIMGSFERFIGILIEHYAGILPTWLAPIQVMVMNITDKQIDYAKDIVQHLQKQQIRARFDLRNEKINYKIREQTLQRIPYLLIVGDKEVAANTVSVRKLNGEDLGAMSPEQFSKLIADDIARLGRI